MDTPRCRQCSATASRWSSSTSRGFSTRGATTHRRCSGAVKDARCRAARNRATRASRRRMSGAVTTQYSSPTSRQRSCREASDARRLVRLCSSPSYSTTRPASSSKRSGTQMNRPSGVRSVRLTCGAGRPASTVHTSRSRVSCGLRECSLREQEPASRLHDRHAVHVEDAAVERLVGKAGPGRRTATLDLAQGQEDRCGRDPAEVGGAGHEESTPGRHPALLRKDHGSLGDPLLGHRSVDLGGDVRVVTHPPPVRPAHLGPRGPTLPRGVDGHGQDRHSRGHARHEGHAVRVPRPPVPSLALSTGS